MMSYQKISSVVEFDRVLERSKSEVIALFKHSSTCELSAVAKLEMVKVKLPVFELTVQTARPLSNHVEAHFGIRHESPQVILIHQGEPIHHASHRAIKADSIHAAVSSAVPA